MIFYREFLDRKLKESNKTLKEVIKEIKIDNKLIQYFYLLIIKLINYINLIIHKVDVYPDYARV